MMEVVADNHFQEDQGVEDNYLQEKDVGDFLVFVGWEEVWPDRKILEDCFSTYHWSQNFLTMYLMLLYDKHMTEL